MRPARYPLVALVIPEPNPPTLRRRPVVHKPFALALRNGDRVGIGIDKFRRHGRHRAPRGNALLAGLAERRPVTSNQGNKEWLSLLLELTKPNVVAAPAYDADFAVEGIAGLHYEVSR